MSEYQEHEGKPAETPLEHLRHAEKDLEKALDQEAKAEENVKKAEAEIAEAIRELEHPKEFEVSVIYDGQTKNFQVRPEELVKTLLDKAIAAFGSLPNAHTLAIYKAGKELMNDKTLKDEGVQPKDKLLLRPSTIRGGVK